MKMRLIESISFWGLVLAVVLLFAVSYWKSARIHARADVAVSDMEQLSCDSTDLGWLRSVQIPKLSFRPPETRRLRVMV